MQETCQGDFSRSNLALYRYQRYQQSLQDNPDFYFGPLIVLLYGAATFLYELMASGTRNYAPDLETISSFFGAQQNADGSWSYNGNERIPANWTSKLSTSLSGTFVPPVSYSSSLRPLNPIQRPGSLG